jgi:hypothetical protein
MWVSILLSYSKISKSEYESGYKISLAKDNLNAKNVQFIPMYIPFHIPQPPEDILCFDGGQWGEAVSMNTVL